MGDYSSGDEASLPGTSANLDHVYDATDLANVGTNDTNYVDQTGSSGYELHQYKDSITASNATVTWIGKSSLAPSSSKVQLQVYKVAAPAGWQDVSGAGASNSVAAADTDFTLSGTIATADYLDTGVTTFRIYQSSGISYTIDDEFTNDVAAGGFSGAALNCVPGPGTRVVADASSYLSITGGYLTNSGVHSDTDDPAIWLEPAVTRSLGVAVVMNVYPAAANAWAHIAGFATAETGDTVSGIFVGNDGNIYMTRGGTTDKVAVGTYAATTDYTMAYILRAAGAWLLLKGGIYTNWTPIGFTRLGTTATLYVELCLTFASANCRCSFIRVPFAAIPLIPVVSDSFNRGDGALGNTDGSGDSEQSGGSGVSWTTQTGTVGISSNTVMASALDGNNIAIATAEAGISNVFVSMNLTCPSGDKEVGIVMRYTDSSNYLIAKVSVATGTIKLTQIISGTPSDLCNSFISYTAGAPLVVRMVGQSAWLVYNDTNFAQTTSIDAGLTGTKFGFWTNATNCVGENIIVWNGNQNSLLSSYE